MKTHWIADPVRYKHMNTADLRETFLLEGLAEPGAVRLRYLDLDRTVLGMAVPLAQPLELEADPLLRAEYFTERRELGVLNIGGAGAVNVGDYRYELEKLDCLYIGRGTPKVSFESKSAEAPAVYYLLSYPAHAQHPTEVIRGADANPSQLGSAATCNRRTVCKYIFLDGAKSCQLVMGVTHLEPGSSWNTMPSHTHARRSEIYMYFNLAAEARVFHMMGPPDETRHLIVKDREIVVSPGWSIHSGVGTEAYSFCWGMGGENQDYADMDPTPLESIR